jgi:hypothetical protein
MIGVAGLALPAAPVAAYSLPSRQPTGTVTSLTAAPNPGRTGGAVTLVASETAANGSHQAGWVQFEADGTDIGGPVSLDSRGVATTRAAVSAGAAADLSAAFVPTSTAYLASAATDTQALNGAGSQAGAISVSVTVPAAGSIAVTVVPGTVILEVHGTVRKTAPIATGLLQAVTVTENRNYRPGWSVTGQASNLSAAGQPIVGSELGWVPDGTVTGGAKLGPPVTPGNPGLGSAGAVLAVATPGSGVGTDSLSAELMLAIPRGAQGGPYAGTLTITFVDTDAQPSAGVLPSAG